VAIWEVEGQRPRTRDSAGRKVKVVV
jgi:hypothetical protein